MHFCWALWNCGAPSLRNLPSVKLSQFMLSETRICLIAASHRQYMQGKQKDSPTYGSRARDPAIPIVQPISVGGYDVYSRMLFQLS